MLCTGTSCISMWPIQGSAPCFVGTCITILQSRWAKTLYLCDTGFHSAPASYSISGDTSTKIFTVFNALGIISFAYGELLLSVNNPSSFGTPEYLPSNHILCVNSSSSFGMPRLSALQPILLSIKAQWNRRGRVASAALRPVNTQLECEVLHLLQLP